MGDEAEKFKFGEIVVNEDGFKGVVVKTYYVKEKYDYDVYVRQFNFIHNYQEHELKHFSSDDSLEEDHI